MTRFPFILIAFVSSFGHAQNLVKITSKVIEDNSREPIAFANVYLHKATSGHLYGTITDVYGYFTLYLPDSLLSDTLQISFVGYKTVSILSKDLLTLKDGIKMKIATTYLSAVVVRDLSAKEIFIKCLSHMNSNYQNTTFLDDCFYWQSIKHDSTFISLNHNLLSVSANVSEKQTNRHWQVDSTFNSGRCDEFHYLEKMENIFRFDFIRSGSRLFKADNLDEWDFSYGLEQLPENYFVINAVRKDKFTTLKMLVCDLDYSIQQVDYLYRWKKDAFFPLNDTLNYKMGELKGRVIYKKVRGHYNVNYVSNEFSYTAFGICSYKKQFTRSVVNEMNTYASKEVKQNLKAPLKKKPAYLPSDFVIINTNAYALAHDALINLLDN